MARAKPAATRTAGAARPASRTQFPDGIDDGHADLRPGHRYANITSIVIFGCVVGAALLGLFGGDRSSPVSVATSDAILTVTTPHTMRSGIFFETRVTIDAHRPIADAVIALPPTLWRDQTINTSIPQADKEASKDGRFQFHYGSLTPGQKLEIKYDGQINPPLFAGTQGDVALLDGDRLIAAVPLTLRVWP